MKRITSFCPLVKGPCIKNHCASYRTTFTEREIEMRNACDIPTYFCDQRTPYCEHFKRDVPDVIDITEDVLERRRLKNEMESGSS
jgi:hypothetical protein